MITFGPIFAASSLGFTAGCFALLVSVRSVPLQIPPVPDAASWESRVFPSTCNTLRDVSHVSHVG